MPKALTVWITADCGEFFKRWEYQTTWPASWEICIQVKKQQLELDTEQTGSKQGKEYVKAIYCHPAYLTYMQSTSWKMPGYKVHFVCEQFILVRSNNLFQICVNYGNLILTYLLRLENLNNKVSQIDVT